MDGRCHAATGRPRQADGPRKCQRRPGRGVLLQRDRASEPWCFLGGEASGHWPMNRPAWWLVEIVSRLLAPDEREAVNGDFAESGESGAQALLGALGLVARRQIELC